LALGAGGCGNSSDESENEPARPAADALPTPTKKQYIAATAKICARADERIGAFIPLGTDPTTRRSSRQAIIEIIREQVDEMRAVGYPPGARAKVESIYRAVEQTLDRAEKDESASIEDGIDEAVHARLWRRLELQVAEDGLHPTVVLALGRDVELLENASDM
jgi:hypothetical protein